jgi:hypothetical protein
MKAQHQQVEDDRSQTLTEFIKEDEISITSGPRCIAVVPCSDKAVVTLPQERSIQFINTTNNTKDNKIKFGEIVRHVLDL